MKNKTTENEFDQQFLSWSLADELIVERLIGGWRVGPEWSHSKAKWIQFLLSAAIEPKRMP